jgi:hypothetical protein
MVYALTLEQARVAAQTAAMERHVSETLDEVSALFTLSRMNGGTTDIGDWPELFAIAEQAREMDRRRRQMERDAELI